MASHLDPYTFKLVDRKPVQCANDDEWWQWYLNMDNRRVAVTCIDDNVTVSTVFVSLDLRPHYPAKLFETKVFGGKLDGREWLADTWEEAEHNHEKVVAYVKET